MRALHQKQYVRSSEIDAATVLFPIAVAGRVQSTAATVFGWIRNGDVGAGRNGLAIRWRRFVLRGNSFGHHRRNVNILVSTLEAAIDPNANDCKRPFRSHKYSADTH